MSGWLDALRSLAAWWHEGLTKLGMQLVEIHGGAAARVPVDPADPDFRPRSVGAGARSAGALTLVDMTRHLFRRVFRLYRAAMSG